MHINKFRISADATNKIRVLRQRSALTPNLICRLAMTASFEQGAVGDAVAPEADGQEFNAYTLFGADQPLFITLLKLAEDEEGELTEDELLIRLRAHIDRGIQFLSARIKTPADVANLMATTKAA